MKNFLRFASFPTTVAARTTQWGLNLVGDTFRGIFTPKSRTRPRKVNRKEKYTKTSSTRKKLWTSSESTSDKK
ncbi:MAG: hypothetical protein LBP53_01085 [Candidatus Peribacteria bacterium]|nr:hypothetical protein [Candidatus Peribacteria bacterium]